MNNIIYQTGDIFLCDSDKMGAKIVKFLMTAPTLWQYIWRAIRHTQQEVRYYHAGMMLNNDQLIEQQSKVQLANAHKIDMREVIVYRKKNLSTLAQKELSKIAQNDLGEGYGIISILGKTLTWLTGINLFEKIIHRPNEEICINRVCYWYQYSIEEKFGKESYKHSTTDTVDDYCAINPEWEIIYKN
jgi:hypothetical protein